MRDRYVFERTGVTQVGPMLGNQSVGTGQPLLGAFRFSVAILFRDIEVYSPNPMQVAAPFRRT